MFKSLQRIAGSVPAHAEVRAASPGLQTRRIQGHFDMRAPSGDQTGAQLDSFRGVVYAAVDKVAKRIAQLPVQLYTASVRGEEIQEKRLFTHPFLNLLSPGYMRRPHEEYSVWEFDYWHQVSMDLTGESWWLVERKDDGTPFRITPMPANRMVVVFNESTGAIAGYMFVPKGYTFQQGTFIPKLSFEELRQNKTAPFMVFHRYPSPRGVEDPRGWSPIKAAAYAYDINLFELIYKRNFLQNGAQLGGILQSEIALSKEQVEEYLHQFESRHKGVKNAGMPIVLPKMLKWTTTEPTPRDIQWIEAMGATESMILQTYGISDAKLGRADIGNRSTAEAMDVTFNREVIQSRIDQKTSKINADFLPIYPDQNDTKYLVAKTEDPVPADAEMAMKREDQDIKNGIITRNEARVKRNLNAFGKFGNTVYMPMTHIPVDPFDASTLENVQDDKDENGYIQKEEDEGKGIEPSEGGEEAESRSRRLLQRDPRDEALIANILAFFESEEIVEQFMASVGGIIASAVAEEIEQASVLMGVQMPDSFADEIMAQAVRDLEIKLLGINLTTRDRIKDILVNGVKQGRSVSALAADVKAEFDLAVDHRAPTIARTQTHSATNFAAYSVYRSAGSPFKRWVSIPDERRRDTHGEAEGQTVPIHAMFEVGGYELEFPGDPLGPAKEVINCRCFMVPSSGEDDGVDRSAIWHSFDARATTIENMLIVAVRDVFAYQHQRVTEVMNG